MVDFVGMAGLADSSQAGLLPRLSAAVMGITKRSISLGCAGLADSGFSSIT
jgi:hypothetical protein